jgi:hypothetical protein
VESKLGPLCTSATEWPIVPAPGDYDDGEFGGMKIGRGNRSTRRKPVPAPLCPPQIPLDTTPGSNPGRRGRKPATNSLNYGATIRTFRISVRSLVRIPYGRTDIYFCLNCMLSLFHHLPLRLTLRYPSTTNNRWTHRFSFYVHTNIISRDNSCGTPDIPSSGVEQRSPTSNPLLVSSELFH